jgi:hypothetical protein
MRESPVNRGSDCIKSTQIGLRPALAGSAGIVSCLLNLNIRQIVDFSPRKEPW